ncbi:MAG: antitoxin VapB family protein [Verrucomicrobiota bacterium]
MATKTISVDLEAYDRLLRAKTSSRESFSQVIKRAEWPVGEGTARSMLEFTRGLYRERGALSDEVLARLDEAQESDGVSPDPWEK